MGKTPYINLMKQIAAFALALGLSTAPAIAEDKEEGLNLMQEGAELLLRGLMNDMEPAIDDLRNVDDIRHYEQPEFLPNGDIIIRRSPDAPLWRAPEAQEDPSGEIEL